MEQKPSRLSVIMLDQGLFTVYKRLFILSLSLNITGLVLAATGHFAYARSRAALFSICNILALTVCRSEAILRLVFWLAVLLLGRSWIPLRLKTATTSLLQSLGGIHSGCGISSIAWLIYALVQTIKDRDHNTTSFTALASSILGLLCLSSIAAFPLARHLHHNIFERTHRFCGWSALALLWPFIILKAAYDPETRSYDNNSVRVFKILVSEQAFWFTFVLTMLIILPWLTIRRVPVKVSTPSTKVSILKFDGGVKAGILGRVSPNPLSEWHAFGIVSDGQNHHMMLAGAVGDFTNSLVSNPPSHLWVRKLKFAGLPYLTHMYDRVVLVATGSGISVFLSFLLQPCKARVCLVWVAKAIEENFGAEVMRMVTTAADVAQHGNNNKIIVHDTAVLGRPDIAKLSVEAAKSFAADVVIVTSNPAGSRDVVRACQDAAIPAFGPIWDS